MNHTDIGPVAIRDLEFQDNARLDFAVASSLSENRVVDRSDEPT